MRFWPDSQFVQSIFFGSYQTLVGMCLDDLSMVVSGRGDNGHSQYLSDNIIISDMTAFLSFRRTVLGYPLSVSLMATPELVRHEVDNGHYLLVQRTISPPCFVGEPLHRGAESKANLILLIT